MIFKNNIFRDKNLFIIFYMLSFIVNSGHGKWRNNECNVEGLDRPVVEVGVIFNKPIEDSRRTMRLYLVICSRENLE